MKLRLQVIARDRRGDEAGAVAAAEHLLNLTDSDFADDHERVLAALTVLSTQYRNQETYDKEVLTRHRGLRLWYALKAPPPAADTSLAAEAQRDLDEVRAHYAKSGLTLTHATPLQLLSNFADHHSVAGRYRRAESLRLQVLALREQAGDRDDVLSGEHQQLGELYLRLGRPAEAEPRFRKAVELRRNAYGSTHFFVASSLLSLADALAANGRPDSAIAAHETALPIIEALYGELHPQTAYFLDRFAALLESGGRRGEAESARGRADSIRKRFRRQ